MATTTQRTAMVQIPLPNWAIFCTAMDSGAIPEARIRPFAYDVLGDYWLTTQPNGAAENTVEDKQQEGAGRRKRQASNAVNTQTDDTIATPARQVRLGGRREQLISLIRSHPYGLT